MLAQVQMPPQLKSRSNSYENSKSHSFVESASFNFYEWITLRCRLNELQVIEKL